MQSNFLRLLNIGNTCTSIIPTPHRLWRMEKTRSVPNGKGRETLRTIEDERQGGGRLTWAKR